MVDLKIDINDYDWKQAFGYAGQKSTREYELIYNIDYPRKASPNINVSESPFSISDVVEIIAKREGEHDGRNWVCVGNSRVR